MLTESTSTIDMQICMAVIRHIDGKTACAFRQYDVDTEHQSGMVRLEPEKDTMLNQIYSVDSAKAVKAQEYGYLNGIHYLAPYDFSGFNLCSHASPGCIAICLGLHSGQAGMVKLETDMNSVRKSRVQKSQRFMRQRAEYMRDMIKDSQRVIRKAHKLGFKPCLRLNGCSDIAWEGIRIRPEWCAVFPELAPYVGMNMFEIFPLVDFVDYTKNPKRFDRPLPANYHLTFSRAEDNEQIALQLLARGVNVAVVFADMVPESWHGFNVIDGDKHDLRQLDPRGPVGTVIGLLPKGRKAKKDQSGFVVRSHLAAAALHAALDAHFARAA